ncbi:MAG: hypothetical protein JSW54_10220 [Fidelibacterota bacterium]|nr:MAG: hypothetical protein JSW54_10220 [Candidatus Neomarinimicrobiota bacterium]
MKPGVAVLMLLSVALGQVQYVRHDALAFKATYYPPLDTHIVARYWETTAVHSEAMYNGNGSWGLGYADWPTRPYPADHPLVRVAARHVLGLLILIEAGLSDSAVVHRARMGLNWLLDNKTAEGAWPLYTTNQGTVNRHSAYPTALAGRVMSRAYRVFRNPRYLLAASKALEWQTVRPQDDSPFYHALVLAELLEHYRTVHEYKLVEQAVDEALIIINRQLPSGSWNDPGPLSTDDHAIVAEALLLLEQALAIDHPQLRRIKGGVNAALNYLLENQLENGNFVSGEAELSAYQVPTFELVALILAKQVRDMREFDMVITGAVRALNTHSSNQDVRWRSNQDGRFLAMAHALAWFTHVHLETRAKEETSSQSSGSVFPP